MRDQFARSSNSAWAAKVRMIDQARSFLRQQLIEIKCGRWVVGGDVFTYRTSVFLRGSGPGEPHELVPDILRRVAARQAAASASTSAAETTSPALAASMPA